MTSKKVSGSITSKTKKTKNKTIESEFYSIIENNEIPGWYGILISKEKMPETIYLDKIKKDFVSSVKNEFDKFEDARLSMMSIQIKLADLYREQLEMANVKKNNFQKKLAEAEEMKENAEKIIQDCKLKLGIK